MEKIEVYDVFVIAKYIVEYCFVNECYCTNVRLQMLLYLVQREFLIKYNKPCFSDDFVAMKFGPSVPKIYAKYSTYGGFAIIPFDQHSFYDINDLNENDVMVINDIIEHTKELNDYDLIMKVKSISPWLVISDLHSNRIISKDLIKIKSNVELKDIYEHCKI